MNDENVRRAPLSTPLSNPVAIVLVNWRGWKDTLECLESVFRMDSPNFRVIIVDNASGDDSLNNIERWANGQLQAESSSQQLAHLSTPPVSKPIPCVRLSEAHISTTQLNPVAQLVLIEAQENRGFAAGCNIGIRVALADLNCDLVWLLNNDTVVTPSAMVSAVRLMEQQQLLMCGSVCAFYHNPDQVQIIGGLNYNKWTGRERPAGFS